jgi:DNA mismatch endonuclease (patch repair protein)
VEEKSLVDRLPAERRSWLMSRVKSKNTSPELRVRRVAHSLGLRFRLHREDLPGRPDLVFPRHKVAVFVHGCFWHRHPGCRKASMPKSRTEYWQRKFDANVSRDATAERELPRLGWRVLIFWECETRDPAAVIETLCRHLRGD